MSYLGPAILSALESKIIDKQGELEAWFAEKRAELTMPIYGSVDIRDAHWKVAVVDANHLYHIHHHRGPQGSDK